MRVGEARESQGRGGSEGRVFSFGGVGWYPRGGEEYKEEMELKKGVSGQWSASQSPAWLDSELVARFESRDRRSKNAFTSHGKDVR